MSPENNDNEPIDNVVNIVDRRSQYDDDGNMIKEKPEAEIAPELDLVDQLRLTIDEQKKATDEMFGQVAVQYNMLAQNIRNALSDMQVRLRIFEELATRPELTEERMAAQIGELSDKQMEAIITDHILPLFEQRAKEMKEEMEQQQKELEDALGATENTLEN